ncbi:MAG TPA: aldo/keto reductase, partial [Hyphomicrobiaceae bacterium]|nr:aldo/keto reductase [Hyphomicrobiaceae bacterium]
MDPFARKRLGRTDIELPRLGLGGAGLGNMFETIPESRAMATLESAWDAGIRYYDTSPWYGRGLSERRFGNVLYSKPREEMIVSTKVGRVLMAPADPAAFADSPRSWERGLHFEHRYDFSYAGIMRAHEDSLQRLGMNRIDLLVIHDLDAANLGSDSRVRAHLSQLATSGIHALGELKSRGMIQGFGAGVNRLGTIPLFLDMVDVDFFLVALPYTLAEQPALDREFPLCEERGVGIIIGAPLASGILATGPVPGAKLNYRDPTPEERLRIGQMHDLCESFDVPLAAAALQFPLLHPLVASVIPG